MEKEDLKKLIDLAYEIEALAGLALRRESVADELMRLIADKCFTAGNMAAAWNIEETEPDTSLPEHEEVVPETKPEAPESESEETVEDVEEPEVEDGSEPDADDSVSDDVREDSENEDSIYDSSLFNDDDENPENEPDFESSDDMEPTDDEQSEISDTEVETFSAAVTDSPRKKIRPYFSVNDMFRFKRELFSNNNADFNDSLNLVETMDSYSEAEDYFYTDLQWDKESDDVMEFMTIISRYFN